MASDQLFIGVQNGHTMLGVGLTKVSLCKKALLMMISTFTRYSGAQAELRLWLMEFKSWISLSTRICLQKVDFQETWKILGRVRKTKVLLSIKSTTSFSTLLLAEITGISLTTSARNLGRTRTPSQWTRITTTKPNGTRLGTTLPLISQLCK
jgi:hypothetical protein